MSHRNRSLECMNPSQKVFDRERGELREFISDGLSHSRKVCILIICQEKVSGSGLGFQGT